MERDNALVDTSSGKLQGSLERSCLGDDYYAFKGIPYAKPPVGDLRFRDPQPLEPWTGIRNATSHGPISAQYDSSSKQVIGSEDCLYLNVYTRNHNASSRSPVMFWVHGGGYNGNGNDSFGPDYLLAKDVVLVTVNCRLGVFGFLNLKDKAASGNQGLKDRVMALKWVNTNIRNFGGDPDSVTIFGGSSGAVDVHYLAMSPMAKGLFHKAICQSLTALSPLARMASREADLSEFFQSLGCQEKDPKDIIEFLKKISFERFIEVQSQLSTAQKAVQSKSSFLPTVDDKSEEPFMPLSVVEAANQGIQVPFMVGYCELEALMFLSCGFNLKDVDQHLENYTSPFIDDMLRENNLTRKELRYLYFKNEAISEKNQFNLRKYWSDLNFVENIHRLVKIQTHCSSAPTYLYKFSYFPSSKTELNIPIKGAGHGDELKYLFKAKGSTESLEKGTGDERLMQQMVELWTNFAKTGRPTVETSDLLPLYWLPVTSGEILRYLSIDEELHMAKELNLEQLYSYKKSST